MTPDQERFYVAARARLKASGYNGEWRQAFPGAPVEWLPRIDQTAQQVSEAQAIWTAWNQAAYDAWVIQQNRAVLVTNLDAGTISDKALRVTLLLIIDQLNLLRQKHNSMRTEILAATSLANLQTRITNNFPAMPDITVQQAKDAITTKINAGNGD